MKEDYMTNSQGHFVPKAMVKPIDVTRDEVVMDVVTQARGLQLAMKEFKQKVMGEIEAFVELSAEQYGAKVGGKKGNVSLLSYDGRLKVQRAIAEHITFDERLQAAKSLIDECINRWSSGSQDEIKVLVDHAFKTDKAGNISTTAVLSLKQLDIQDTTWKKAMTAISDSIQVVGSKSYVRIYQRVGDSDQWQPIALDIAAL
jgi:Protein of unknown function (DUF3164)